MGTGRALVTGGAGFIGSHIVEELLRAGYEASVVDDLSSGHEENLVPGVPFYRVDVRNREGLARVFDRVNPDFVFHEAAQISVSRSVREAAFDAEINILGFLNVLDESVRAGAKRVVFASSGGTLYGDVTVPATEDSPLQPVSPYGISKLTGERYLEFYSRQHGITGVALRYGNVYGPRQDPHGEAGVVAIFAKKFCNGETATIFGDGRYVRDYVYVGDVAAANVKALEAKLPSQFMAINVGTAVGTDVNVLEAGIREAFDQCCAGAGSRVACSPPAYGPERAGDLRSSLLSPVRAGEILGWVPTVELHQGLAHTMSWFHKNLTGR